ncbi:MAG: MATE family efflux transporter [Clostridia bacterium]|nr:MATE family efflux transporter [Clostridia bacterium]
MLFSNKDLFKIVLPLFIEQMLAVTIGMLDSIMVSSVGEAAVSGVSLVDTINLLLSYIFSALATGGAVVCSQFLGRRESANARASAKQLLYSVTAVALVLMAVCLIFKNTILSLVFGSISDEIMGHAQIYFFFTVLSYPFLALYNGGAALFRSMGDSKTSMLVSTLMNLLNVAGNALLIYVFHMGVAGAAISTLFSRIVGSVLITVLLHNKSKLIYIEKIFRYRPDFKIIKSILNIGVPAGMENGMFQFGKLLTTSLISTFGTAAIAANAVAGTVACFEYAVGGAIGLTLVTVVGRCVGAGEKEAAKKYVKKLMGIEYVSMVVVAILLTVLAKPITSAYNLSAEASSLAVLLILLHNLFSITTWPVAFTLPNAFRAASDVKFTMYISIASMWIFRIGFSYLLSGIGIFTLGLLGVWIAMFVDWFFRGTVFAVRFVSGKWLTKYRPPEVSDS